MSDAPHVEPTAAATLLGRTWLGFDDSGEEGLIRFAPTVDLTNRHGTVQGGFLAAMLDSATGLRALATLPEGKTAVTVSLTTRFLKPARLAPFLARARITERTEREIAVTAALFDREGVEVAQGDARLRVLDKRQR